MKFWDSKQNRYSLLFLVISLFHIALGIVYWIEQCRILFNFNMMLLIIYLLMAFIAKKSVDFTPLLTVCAGMLVIHVIANALLLGPMYGFQYLFLGVIPVIFCLAYMSGKGLRKTVYISIAVMISFLLLLMISSQIKEPIFKVSMISKNVILLLNVFASFFMSMFFMCLLVMQVRNVTGVLKNKNINLEESAGIDTLTGLKNRRTLSYYLEQAFFKARGEGQDFSILMCDIDDFKKVNDTYGHECGDLVLKNIASILTSATRPEDVVFRWGGEEMMILVAGGKYNAEKIAERCRKSVEESEVMWNDIPVKVTITIGGASYYQGADEKILMDRADGNLYTGKGNGKNQVVM